MIGCPEAVESLATAQRAAPRLPTRDYLAAWMRVALAGAWSTAAPVMVVDALWLKSPGQPTHVRSITWNWSYFVLALIPGARLMILAPSDTLLSKFSWRAQPTGDAAIILKSWPWMIFYMTFSMYIRRCNSRYYVCNKKDMFLWIENEKFAKQMILW